MSALEAQYSTIFDFMQDIALKKKQLKNKPFLRDSDLLIFDEYIEPQFNWAWKNWIETQSESFLDISLFWVQQYFKLTKNKSL